MPADLIYTRLMKPEEKTLLAKWLYENRHKNNFDPTPFLKDQVTVYVAYDSTGILFFLPVRTIWIWDSLAPRPDLPETKSAQCLKALQQLLVFEASQNNVGEFFFKASEESVPAFAKNYGWDEAKNMHSFNVNKLEPVKEIA